MGKGGRKIRLAKLFNSTSTSILDKFECFFCTGGKGGGGSQCAKHCGVYRSENGGPNGKESNVKTQNF